MTQKQYIDAVKTLGFEYDNWERHNTMLFFNSSNEALTVVYEPKTGHALINTGGIHALVIDNRVTQCFRFKGFVPESAVKNFRTRLECALELTLNGRA